MLKLARCYLLSINKESDIRKIGEQSETLRTMMNHGKLIVRIRIILVQFPSWHKKIN